jgi:cytochrome c-type biogenesis protein CcmF
VQSVHAFDGDPVSLTLFGILIAVAFAAGVFGALGRRRSFAVQDGLDAEAALAGRSMAYYLLNVLMMVGAFLLCYLTVASALPQPLPFAGQSISAETYNAIARPVSIALMLLVAVCPLLGWSRTDPVKFAKKALPAGVCAFLLFIVLMAYFALALLPAYDAAIAAGGTTAESIQAMGPALYYNGLAALGLAVACCLFFNSLFMLAKLLRAPGGDVRRRFTAIGGFLAHLALGVMLVGLIGSSMYVTERTGYLAGSPDSDASTVFAVQDYELSYVSDSVDEADDGITYTVVLDVSRGGQALGQVTPSVYVDKSTMQQRLDAQVLTMPDHDLFVVYRGVNMNGDFSLDVRVNPLILCVWAGFILLMLGTAIAALARRP